jgi:hypothetical protein
MYKRDSLTPELKLEVSEEQCKHGTICHTMEIENRRCVLWNSNDDVVGVGLGGQGVCVGSIFKYVLTFERTAKIWSLIIL